MKNIFIIHGFMGSNIENWFPYVKEKIDSRNINCVIPQFPIDIKNHNYDKWKKLLDLYNYEYNMIDENTIMIGHSTGSICCVKYLIDTKTKIDKLILVSGFNNVFAEDKDDIHNKINPTYYMEDDQLKEINKYVKEVICIYGDNDPYIPQSNLHEFAEKISAKEIVVQGGGHLNKESGYSKFDEMIEILSKG